MAEKPADKSQESPKKALDLNTLSGLDFGPSWADEKAKRPSHKQYESRGDSRGKGKRSGGSGTSAAKSKPQIALSPHSFWPAAPPCYHPSLLLALSFPSIMS